MTTEAQPKIVSNSSPHVGVIIQLFLQKNIGDIVSPDEIATVTHCTKRMGQGGWQPAANVAVRRVRELGIVAKNLGKNQGYLLLRPNEVSGETDRRLRKARHQAKAGLQIANTIDEDKFKQLKPDEQATWIQTRAKAAITLDTLRPSGRMPSSKVKTEFPMLPEFLDGGKRKKN